MLNKNLEFVSHAEGKRSRQQRNDAAKTSETKQADIDFIAVMEGIELPSWEEGQDE